MASSAGGLSGHWIGVERGWQGRDGGKGGDPLGRLVSLTTADLLTHALILGATGTGKTVHLHHHIARDVLLGHSLVVLDLRGDLVAAALRIMAGRTDPRLVRVLDLRERREPVGFDPLHGAGEPYFRALGVLAAVEAGAESWGIQLAETLRYGLMLLAEAGEPLTRLEAVLYDEGFLRSCLGACEEPSTAGFWTRYLDLPEPKRAALASPVLNKVSLLLSTAALRGMLGSARPLDLGRHLDRKGSVTLVSLAADETHAAGRMMGRIFLASFCREIFARVGEAESRRNPVRLYVDEFSHFGEREFEELLAEGRRFGLSLVIAHQTLAQLTPRMRAMVLGNVGVKVVFRCGREDARTMSRDLAGDPGALDLASLGTGEAYLWRRGREPVAIETNAPIVPDVGRRSPRAEALLRAAREAANEGPGLPRRVPPVVDPHAVREERGGDDRADAGGGRNLRHPPDWLEDWL